MFCPQCGKPIFDRAKLCALCGAGIGEGGTALGAVEPGSLSFATAPGRPEAANGRSSEAALGGNIALLATQAAPGLAARVRNVLARLASVGH